MGALVVTHLDAGAKGPMFKFPGRPSIFEI